MNTEQKSFIDYNTAGDFIEKYDYAVKQPVKWAIKRCIDVSHAIIGLFLLFPVLLVSGIAIKKESDGPVIFKQTRIGLKGKTFAIYKLRTMYDHSGPEYVKSENDSRITHVGKILRKYSIDEIPQLINIIKGDMSLVGPRPLRPSVFNEIQAKNPDFQLRLATKPGLRLNIGRLENGAFNKDIPAIEREYIENWSLSKDFIIFVALIKDTIKGKNY